jgi:hypothetical protein
VEAPVEYGQRQGKMVLMSGAGVQWRPAGVESNAVATLQSEKKANQASQRGVLAFFKSTPFLQSLGDVVLLNTSS